LKALDNCCWRNGKRNFDKIAWFYTGFVYGLEDRASPGMVKVGESMIDPAIRAREIAREMQKDTIALFYWAFVWKPAVVEQQVHEVLSERRVQGEWFDVPLHEAIETIRAVAGHGLIFDSESWRK